MIKTDTWYKVEDMLPDINRNVLLYDLEGQSFEVAKLTYINKREHLYWITVDGFEDHVNSYTHWMYIPDIKEK